MTSGYYIAERPTNDRPLICKISNGDISATGHPIHSMLGSTVGFRNRLMKWRYFRLDQIKYCGYESGVSLISEWRVAYVWFEEVGNKRAALL